MEIAQVKKIMKDNFIGPDELNRIADGFKIAPLTDVKLPKIRFSEEILRKSSRSHLLILGVPAFSDGKKLTLNSLRELFGTDPDAHEPCFYNQDWYLKERFASETNLKFGWYLIRKNVKPDTRGKAIAGIAEGLSQVEKFPPAVLTAYAFFAWYLLHEEPLWSSDFIWCSDKDHNGDQVYAGRYHDPNKINKNGFNIHRHLSIRKCYGLASEIKI